MSFRRRACSAQTPFDPARLPFYYGWVILPVAMMATITSMPGQTAGFSPFSEPLLTVTGLSRTELSTCYLIGTMISGLLLPGAGRLVDRLGCRRALVLACICLGLTLLCMSRLLAIVAATLLRVMPPGIAYTCALAAGVLAMRFFGQGLLPIVGNTLIGRWFERRRGRAVAFMSITSSLTFSAAPIALHQLVLSYQWHGAWLRLGLIAGVLVAAVGWLLARDSPEACGLRVDGGAALDQEVPVVSGVTAAEAAATLAFWTIGLIMCTHGMLITGITFHVVAFGAEAGLSANGSLAMFIPASAIGIPTSFVVAWLSDRIGVRRILQFMATAELLAYGALSFLQHPAGYPVAVVGLGLTSGCFGPILTIALPRYFGRRHLGAINGKFHSLLVLASAVGPIYLALVNRALGAFRMATIIALIMPLVGLILTLRLRDRSGDEPSRL